MRIFKKAKIKNEKGSVTLYVLIAMLFFLVVGLTIFMTTMNQSTDQERAVQRIQDEYSNEKDLNVLYSEQLQKHSID